MTRQEIRETISQLLAIVETGVDDEADREARLRAALDRLALAYHFAAAPPDDRDYPDPPRQTYEDLRARIAPRFPRLGFYNVALDISENIGASVTGTGDALDDITDIALDLHVVLARWESTSEEDALFHFRLGFETHWGRHLRELQLYLHDLAF